MCVYFQMCNTAKNKTDFFMYVIQSFRMQLKNVQSNAAQIKLRI